MWMWRGVNIVNPQTYLHLTVSLLLILVLAFCSVTNHLAVADDNCAVDFKMRFHDKWSPAESNMHQPAPFIRLCLGEFISQSLSYCSAGNLWPVLGITQFCILATIFRLKCDQQQRQVNINRFRLNAAEIRTKNAFLKGFGKRWTLIGVWVHSWTDLQL